jgi:hypothetical protein
MICTVTMLSTHCALGWRIMTVHTLHCVSVDCELDYKHIKIQLPAFEGGYSHRDYHNAVTEMYINAARLKPNNPDPGNTKFTC